MTNRFSNDARLIAAMLARVVHTIAPDTCWAEVEALIAAHEGRATLSAAKIAATPAPTGDKVTPVEPTEEEPTYEEWKRAWLVTHQGSTPLEYDVGKGRLRRSPPPCRPAGEGRTGMKTIVVQWVPEKDFGYDMAMRVIASDHERFVVGHRFDFGFFQIATVEGYTIVSLPLKVGLT